MKKIITILIMLAITLVAPGAYAAESATIRTYDIGSLSVVELAWTTDSAGNFTAATTDYGVNGVLVGGETIPSSTAAPSANYDIIVSNADGRLVCGDSGNTTTPNQDGVFANRSATVTEYTRFKSNSNYQAVESIGQLTFDVFNAGNSKSGTIRIFYF